MRDSHLTVSVFRRCLGRHFVAGFAFSAALAALADGNSVAPPAPVALVRTVADAVLRDTPKPPDFDWGEGVLLSGMIEAHRLTKDPRYLDLVRRFAEHWSQRGIGPLLSAKGYCGHWGPAFAMLELSDLTGQPKPLALADEVVEFILHRATRTSDGGLDHFAGKPELWVDTLDMCCPVLATKARLAHRPELQTEARQQLEIFARHLQDPATGLFYHQWSETTGQRTTNFWARGNGWVVLASLETLRSEPPDSAPAKHLRAMLEKQLASIIRLQDSATGLWHTVLDAPDTYVETSASAMFLYGMVEGCRLKLIEPPSRACLEAGANVLNLTFDEKRIFDNMSLHVERGEIYAVLGRNGTGKSTLAGVILGLIKPESGDIFFEGERINDLSVSDRAKRGIILGWPAAMAARISRSMAVRLHNASAQPRSPHPQTGPTSAASTM